MVKKLIFRSVQTFPPPIASNCETVPKNVTVTAFDETGQFLFTGGEDFRVKVWDHRNNMQCKFIFQVNIFCCEIF